MTLRTLTLAQAAAVDVRPEPSPEEVRHRLQRSRIIPRVLAVPCEAHGAAVGEPCMCTVRGVCAARVIARAARP